MTPEIWTIKMAVLSWQTSYETERFTAIQGKSRPGNPAQRKVTLHHTDRGSQYTGQPYQQLL